MRGQGLCLSIQELPEAVGPWGQEDSGCPEGGRGEVAFPRGGISVWGGEESGEGRRRGSHGSECAEPCT